MEKSLDLNFFHNSKFNLYIKESSLKYAGLGIFTRDFIPSNTFIDYYEGDLTTCLIGGTYFFQINDKYGMDAFNFPRCYMAMLNDTDYKPIIKHKKKKIIIENNYINNCYFEVDEENLKIMVYSKIDIEKDSELFISYGPNYWNE